MTPTGKQKTLSEQSVYGDLMGLLNDKVYPIKWITSTLNVYYDGKKVDDKFYRHLSETTPILRPLSDLTKEITHAGYNNNQPFIPLVELAKIRYPDRNHYELTKTFFLGNIIVCSDGKGSDECDMYAPFSFRQDELDFLNMLHFDTRSLIESGEAIDANSLPKNPYEV